MIEDKDGEILFELLQDGRQSLSKISKIVKLPQQTISYRISKLEKEGIITKNTININYPKLGYSRHSLYLDVKGISLEETGRCLQLIKNIKEVSCCSMLYGMSEWKVYVSVWTKTLERYDEIQTEIISKFKKYVKDYISFQSVKSWTYFPRILNKRKKAKCDFKENPSNFEIKEIDWKIMERLKRDSNMPIIKIASEVNANANTIIRRIKFLNKNNIIQRYYPIINTKKMGYTEYTFILRIDPSCEKEIKEFLKFANNDPRFVMIIKAVGYANLYYSFLAKDEKELVEVSQKIEDILGKATLKTYKIEVDEIVN